MSNPTTDQTHNPFSLVMNVMNGLEDLRSRLVDLEALTHAAVRTLEHLPYVPPASRERAVTVEGVSDLPSDVLDVEARSDDATLVPIAKDETHESASPKTATGEAGEVSDIRIHLGRLQSLVHGSAETSYELLLEVMRLIEQTSQLVKAGGKHGTSTACEPRALYLAGYDPRATDRLPC